jgi:hypothetical protein
MKKFTLAVSVMLTLTTHLAGAQEANRPSTSDFGGGAQVHSSTSEPAQRDGWRSPALVTGATVFGVSYGLALAVAIADAAGKPSCNGFGVAYAEDSDCDLKHVGRPLFIPIVGPLLAIHRDAYTGVKMTLLSDALLQLAGASLLIVSLVPSKQKDTRANRGLTVHPVAGIGTVGLVGQF